MDTFIKYYVLLFVLIVVGNGVYSLKETGHLKEVLLMATLNVLWVVYFLFMVISIPLARRKLKNQDTNGNITGKVTKMWGIDPRREDWERPKNILKILFIKPKRES